MKICTKCLKNKSLSEFSKKLKRFNSWCKACQKEYKDNHYRSNKKDYIVKVREYKRELKKWIDSLKSDRPCVDCDNKYHPVCMDFDHIGDNKKFNIATASRRYGRKAILEEIKKCELVCANCHRMRTLKRLKLP